MNQRQRVIDWLEEALVEMNGGTVRDRHANGFVLECDLTQTQVVVLNKQVSVNAIRGLLEANAQNGMYTLFIFDQKMLPPVDDVVEFSDMPTFAAVHAITYGRVYAYYDHDDGDPSICSVHFEPEDGDRNVRRTMYEMDVDLTLNWAVNTTKARVLGGTFWVATFSDDVFWKWRTTSRQRQTHNAYNPGYQTWKQWEQSFWNDFTNQGGERVYTNYHHNTHHYDPPPPPPPPPAQRSEYEVLGIRRGCSLAEARAAYRKLALANHPDRHPGEEADYTQRMAEINRAWDTVKRWLS